MQSKEGNYKLKEPNYIGQIGEIIAKCILEKEFPRPVYRIVKSHTYPYGTDICERCELRFPVKTLHAPPSGSLAIANELSRITRAQGCLDFLLESDSERIIVEVKTTMKKSFSISGANNRRYLKKQIIEYMIDYPKAKIFILFVSLANFPDIEYKLEELSTVQ